MGGSIGLAIKKRELAHEVAGVSLRQSSLATALKSNVIDRSYSEISKAVHQADFVVLATPVSVIVNLLSTLGPYLKRGCIITDVGSTKAIIVETAEKFLPQHCYFVGSHPLTGSQKQGAAYASEDLFRNAVCIMTPTERTSRVAREKVKHFWTVIGSSVKFLSPQEHDKILSFTSHLPHLLAYALIQSIPGDYLQYAAQGLKDTTRIASSSPQMWLDICKTNSREILQALDESTKFLSAFRKAILANDDQALIEHFQKAKEKRDGLG